LILKNPILIVGGGFGGLTAALALARQGQPVRVPPSAMASSSGLMSFMRSIALA